MDGRRFRLVVHDVKKLNGFCTVADGVVEGGGISVDDYVCLDSIDGKRIKVRVAGIMVAPSLEVRTAEPGKAVWLVLRGRKAKQIRRGELAAKTAARRLGYRFPGAEMLARSLSASPSDGGTDGAHRCVFLSVGCGRSPYAASPLGQR